MIFEKLLMPDLLCASFRDITPDLMKKLGKKALISDIDNTLVPYEVLDATDEIVSWVNALRENGVAVSFVSNNQAERVERFNEKLSCIAFADVHKPSVKYLLRSAEITGVAPKDTLFLGDQLLTDALAAHRCGMQAAIVPPIKDKTSLFFKIKRLIERPYIKKYDRLINNKLPSRN